MTNKKQNKAPAMTAYSVREAGKKSYWTRIGAAWAHEDGDGFNLQLDCFPVDGKITLRKPKADDQAETTDEAGA